MRAFIPTVTEDLLLHAVILLHGLRLPARVLRWVFLGATREASDFVASGAFVASKGLVVVVLQYSRLSWSHL